MSGSQSPVETGPPEASGRPGRYQRSVSGLIGAMVILLGTVVVFIGFRGLIRDNPDAPLVRPVAYEQVVGPASEQVGWPVAAPTALPPDWVARTVRFEPPPGASWHLGLLTDEQQYVGIEQGLSSAAAMVEAYVGEDAVAGGTLMLPQPTKAGQIDEAAGQIAWRRWKAEDGDIAVTTRVGDQSLLVVTTDDERTLRTIVDTLELAG